MSSHLRRVLLAKGVVDTRNPRYTRRKPNKDDGVCNRSRSLEGSHTKNLIDRLACDTEHFSQVRITLLILLYNIH